MPLSHVQDLDSHNINERIARFVVPQRYADYTETDHQTWVTLMGQLLPFWQECAHPDFIAGLSKTGISLERIPEIETIDRCLQRFDWRAVTVDGYIAPEVFMGLQSRRIIPVARDIRKPENLGYTPAPDIVHEAAAHVPLLINEDYGRIVQRFGELSLKAGYSAYDEAVYEAVRKLSNIKENPTTTANEIADAEAELAQITTAGFTEESSIGKQLTRLYWWTIEYGLVGEDEDELKIYGAGLLSSVSEGTLALRSPDEGGPEHRLLDESAFHLDFDITRPQPQLFIAPTFEAINDLLDTFAHKYGL